MAAKKSGRKSSSKKSSSKKSSSKKSSSSRSRGSSSKSSSKKKSSSRKYGPKAQQEVRTEMHHLKQGEHKNRKQAIAIGLSKARRKGAKVPPRKKAA
jgi:Family of unknown function (DUF6496)